VRKKEAARRALLEARAEGATLRQAAAAAGIHVATVCRWQTHDPAFHKRMREATAEARQAWLPDTGRPRPRVRWRKDCPLCRARVVVRTAPGKLTFWRCGRWPRCGWASWRPRAPRDCPRCGSPRYWSHSRKSVGCPGCGLRTRRD
jgi:hypothetical protein